MPTYADTYPTRIEAAHRRASLNRAFAAHMIQPRNADASFRFQPDYKNPPRVRDLEPDALRYILEYRGRRLTRARVLDRACTAIHEAAHIVAYILTGNPVYWVRIMGGRDGRAGEVNTSCHNSEACEGFHALMGAACELELGLGLKGAVGDMASARASIGPSVLHDTPRDDVPAVLEIAREFFRAARGAINFIAIWLLACTSANGRVEGPRLREIIKAARPAVIAAARRVQIIPRLNAIQQRREEAHRALRDSRPAIDWMAELEAMSPKPESGSTRLH